MIDLLRWSERRHRGARFPRMRVFVLPPRLALPACHGLVAARLCGSISGRLVFVAYTVVARISDELQARHQLGLQLALRQRVIKGEIEPYLAAFTCGYVNC